MADVKEKIEKDIEKDIEKALKKASKEAGGHRKRRCVLCGAMTISPCLLERPS